MNQHSFVRELSRRDLLRGALAAPLAAGPGKSAARPLNFVFILADDLGWADLTCYGGDLHETRTSTGWPGRACALPMRMPPRPSARRRGHRS